MNPVGIVPSEKVRSTVPLTLSVVVPKATTPCIFPERKRSGLALSDMAEQKARGRGVSPTAM